MIFFFSFFFFYIYMALVGWICMHSYGCVVQRKSDDGF